MWKAAPSVKSESTHLAAKLHMQNDFEKKIFFFFTIYVYEYTVADMPAEGAADPITDGCEPPWGCWELNP